MRWLVALVVCWTAVARADTRHVAVVVADSHHHARSDAGKVARVLATLGGVAADDLIVGEDRGDALAQARRRIAAVRAPGDRVVLVFYYAGKDLGLAPGELRKELAATGADTRIAFVDACTPPAPLEPGGGAFESAFAVQAVSDGEDVIVTSHADERAVEQAELGGSPFTHHLVSALRGAADRSGDGAVTVGEAFAYAYEHTVGAHDAPAVGQGDVVLSELGKPAATLDLPHGFDRVLVYARARGEVVAELAADAPPTIGVEPGGYAIRAWRAGDVLGGEVRVAAGEHRAVRWDELSVRDPAARRTAGVAEAAPDAPAPRAQMLVAGGASASPAGDARAIPAMRAEVALPGGIAIAVIASSRRAGDGSGETSTAALVGYRLALARGGWSAWGGAEGGGGIAIAVIASSRRAGDGSGETSTAALVGYRLALARGGWSAWGGAEGGGGIVMQTPVAGPVAYAPAALAGPCAGIARRVGEQVSLALEAAVPVALVRQGGALSAIALPAAWLGARFAL